MLATEMALPKFPSQSTRIQLYRLRAITHGNEYWTCPWCANKNVSRLFPDVYIVECTGSGCGGRFYPGRLFIPIPPGRPRMPSDWTVPEGNTLIETFPTGELNRDPWKGGDRVHRVYISEAQRELIVIERFMARVTDTMRARQGQFAWAVERELQYMRGKVALYADQRVATFGSDVDPERVGLAPAALSAPTIAGLHSSPASDTVDVATSKSKKRAKVCRGKGEKD
jgi:hypothetical protein